jgi:hypothetical protein
MFTRPELAVLLQALGLAERYYKDNGCHVAGMFPPTEDTRKERLASIQPLIERIIAIEQDGRR